MGYIQNIINRQAPSDLHTFNLYVYLFDLNQNTNKQNSMAIQKYKTRFRLLQFSAICYFKCVF